MLQEAMPDLLHQMGAVENPIMQASSGLLPPAFPPFPLCPQKTPFTLVSSDQSLIEALPGHAGCAWKGLRPLYQHGQRLAGLGF